MTPLRNVTWPKVIAESAIIVASVLLAFWLESWWSDRQAAVEERAILMPLRAEIVAIAEKSGILLIRADALYDSSASLANLALQKGQLEIGDDELYRLFGDFLFHVDAKFTTAPVLESLFYTGDLDLISNSELRRDIAEIRIHLSNLRTEIDRESEYFNKTVIPYLQQNADIAPFYTNETFEPGYWGNPEFSYSYRGLMQGTMNPPVELLASREFLNIVLHRLTTLSNAVWEWRATDLEERLARIVTLIDQELGVS